MEITLGIAASLLSGADLALLYDTQIMLEDDETNEHSHAIAQLGFIKSSAEALGALIGGALAFYSFELMMVLVQSGAAWMCLVLALLVIEPPYKEPANKADRVKILDILKHLLLRDPVLRRIVVAIPLYSLANFHVAWLVQPYWEAQGLSLAVFGAFWCAQSLTVAMANKCGFVIERRLGAIVALSLIGILPILGHFGMAWFNGWLGIGMGLSLFVCRGLNQVILVNALNRRVPSEFRATANSFSSFLFRLAFIATGPLVGTSAEVHGLNATLNLLGVASIALFVLVMLPLIQSVKTSQQAAIA
jgi:hypothetical protein